MGDSIIIYIVIGFFAFLCYCDDVNNNAIEAFTEGAFWLPLLIIRTTKTLILIIAKEFKK